MEYYKKERNWKQVLEFIKGVKGMHSKDEKRLRIALLHDIGLIEHKTVQLPLSTEDLPSIEMLRQVNAWVGGID